MTSAAKEVWREIEEDIIVRRALEKGIVSLKNLTVYLLKKKKITASADAVISAIRRYKEEKPLERKFETILLIIQGEQSIKLIFNDKNKNKILSLFSKKSILVIQENLAEINIHLSEEAVKTPGILVVLTTELMMHNINIVETMSCVPEMLFFVHQKDIVKSYELLFKLCKA